MFRGEAKELRTVSKAGLDDVRRSKYLDCYRGNGVVALVLLMLHIVQYYQREIGRKTRPEGKERLE